MEDLIQGIFESNDGEIFGFADLKGILDQQFQDYTHAVSLALKVNPVIVDSIASGPNQAYCDEYKRVNEQLDWLSSLIESEIIGNGHKARAIPSSERTDLIGIKGEFPHKTAATRAGIGWIGKSSLLVTKRNGPRLRLSTVLTDYPLKSNTPVEKDFCGKCTRCIEMCPAGAIFGKGWKPGIERIQLIDVQRCDNWKKENYAEYCDGHVCGICVSVCPFGRRGDK